MIRPSALYIHVPFCRSKCAYCDFFSVEAATAAESFRERLVDSTLRRAAELSERFGARRYETIYVGGGTPTILGPPLLGRLLAGLAGLAGGATEWTVEANPDSLDPACLEAMAAAGVTRLSLGVQSLDDGALVLLGRPHRAVQAEAALRLAAGYGLRLSADLIAALPSPRDSLRRRESAAGAGRSLSAEVGRLLELSVGHLSIYDLVVEEGTRIAASLESGELEEADEDEAWEERRAAEAVLAKAGFRRYEVSNYAPAGSECAHNLAYWRMDSYVGAGPGAVSTIAEEGGSLRIEETRNLEAYLGCAAENAREERISPRDSAFELAMMGFRTRFGLDLDSFASRFGKEFEELVPRTLSAWNERISAGWGRGRRLALDERGLDILNRFLADCLAEMETSFPAA